MCFNGENISFLDNEIFSQVILSSFLKFYYLVKSANMLSSDQLLLVMFNIYDDLFPLNYETLIVNTQIYL